MFKYIYPLELFLFYQSKIMNTADNTILYQSDIRSCILHSDWDAKEKDKFLNLISYFTPQEIEELRELVCVA